VGQDDVTVKGSYWVAEMPRCLGTTIR
jgi:hypothetical protein